MTPLKRNRDFVLLVSGQLLSTAGSQFTSVAYPLLVLALTHSPVWAGIVAFCRLVPSPVLGPLAGVAADRWDRKRLMIASDAVRALSVGALAVGIVFGAPIWLIPVIAAVEGIGSLFFDVAQAGALRAVVPAAQLPAAVGVSQARAATVSLVGPPVGGALFGLARSLPFLADAVSYLFSFLSLIAMRTPFQQPRDRETAPLRTQLAEGFTFLWNQPFLRTTTLLYGIGNFALPGIFLVIIVVARRQGLAAAEIGILFAVFGAFILGGSLLSPLFRRRFSMRVIILIELYTWLGSGLFLVWPNVYVLALGILPQAIAMPITDSVVIGYRIAITPDRLIGRVESVRTTIAQALYPLGPLVAGILLSSISPRATVGVFAACGLILATWGTASSAIRNAPTHREVAQTGTSPA